VGLLKASHFGYLATLMCLLVGLVFGPALGQSDAVKTTDELQGIKRQLGQSEQREKQIIRELTALEREAVDISQRLIDLAAKSQNGEAKISAGESKIASLNTRQKQLAAQLTTRRDALGELLVGLQRLERDPPPPLVAHPRDALAAIRSATLFGAIIPAIKAETTAIRGDLVRLKNVRISLLTAQKDVETENKTLDGVRAELNALLERKKSFVRKTRAQLLEEKKRTAALVAKAKNLNQLLDQIRAEKLKAEQLKAEKLKAEAAHKSQAARQAAEAARQAQAARRARLLAPKIPFSKTVGRLPFPAHGALLRKFNEKNKLGQTSQGVLLATRKQAQITAPAGGVIEFAGEFRSYGQLLILNVGEGYRMLFGGLGKINVETGQQVNAGEPIGFMGDKAARGTLITSALDVRQPVLYIEFRKNGGPVDPSTWWLPNHKRVQN